MKTFSFVFDPEATTQNTLDLMQKSIESGVPYIEKDQVRHLQLKHSLK